MFSENHRARLKDEDPVVPQLVAVKEMLSQGSTKGTPADDDNVKGSRIRWPGCAAHCLIETVANVAAEHILAEIRVLRAWTCHLVISLLSAMRGLQTAPLEPTTQICPAWF